MTTATGNQHPGMAFQMFELDLDQWIRADGEEAAPCEKTEAPFPWFTGEDEKMGFGSMDFNAMLRAGFLQGGRTQDAIDRLLSFMMYEELSAGKAINPGHHTNQIDKMTVRNLAHIWIHDGVDGLVDYFDENCLKARRHCWLVIDFCHRLRLLLKELCEFSKAPDLEVSQGTAAVLMEMARKKRIWRCLCDQVLGENVRWVST